MHNDTFSGTARHRLPASRSKPRLPLLSWVKIDSERMGYQEGKGSLQIRSVAAVAADATRVVWECREGGSVTPVA